MNWLITGGCGFIGSALIERLRQQGAQSIRVIDNLSVGTRQDLGNVTKFREISGALTESEPQGVELVVGDILDENLARSVSRGCDVIVHLAANTGVGPSVEDPRSDCMANVIGTLNYLEAARINKVPRFIFASSGAPAGEVEPPIHEELAPHPVSPYGASKLAGEGYCSAYKRTFGINTVVLRFGNVYGPGSGHKSSVVAKFIRRAISGQPLEIFGDGGQTRDFIFIEDLINAILLAEKTPDIGGEIFQIASSMETTVAELADLLVKILVSSGIGRAEVVHTDTRLGDVRRNYSDTTKAQIRLGWTSDTQLGDGLQKTVDYFLKNK